MIREAKISDANQISKIIKENVEFVRENNYSKEESDVWKGANNPKKIKKDIKTKKIFILIENKKIIGTIGLNKNEVCGFYMDYHLRGTGEGTKLFNFIENYAKKKKIKKLILSASPSALNYYKKRGFIEKGPNKYRVNSEISLLETLMEKTLK